MDELHYKTIGELSKLIQHGKLSPLTVTEAILDRIEALDTKLHAYVTLTKEQALKRAEQAEVEIQAGNYLGPLHGIPIAVKDLFATTGIRTTCGTKVFKNWVPDYDATVLRRLKAAGAIMLGKLQMTEGAFSAHHPDVKPPINPWNSNYWTGVSSSGSGVATAAGLCYATLGSDTGGSIRTPSAANALVGMKPTYGRVSLWGAHPLSPLIDHIGPMTRSVLDTALVLQTIAGYDEADTSSLRAAVPDYVATIKDSVRNLVIGIDRNYLTEYVDEELQTAVFQALETCAQLGCKIKDIVFPDASQLLRGWKYFLGYETLKVHKENFPKRADEYGPILRELLELGQKTSEKTYMEIVTAKEQFSKNLQTLFDEVDVIACPSMPMARPPARLTEKKILDPESSGTTRLKFAVPFNFSGNPTISLPCGFTEDNMPLGLQFVAAHLQEAKLLQVAYAFEQATPWHERHPI